MSQKSADFTESGDNTRFSESPATSVANDAHSKFHDLVYRMPTSLERTGSSQVVPIPNATAGDSGVTMLPNATPGDAQAQTLLYTPGGDAYGYTGGGGQHRGGHGHCHGGREGGAVGNASYDNMSPTGQATNVIYDANGNPIPIPAGAVDANGNPIQTAAVDASGNPLPVGNGTLPNGATNCGWNNAYTNGAIGQPGAFDNTQSLPTGGNNAQFDANGNLIPAGSYNGSFDSRGNFVPATGQGQADNPMAGLPTTGPGGVVDGGTFIPSVNQNNGSLDGNGALMPTTANNSGTMDGGGTTTQGMPSDNTKQLQISQSDFQTMLQSWAAVNGADLTNQSSYTQLGKSMSDGQSTAVGPFQLDATAIQSWTSKLQGQNGQLDSNAVGQLVQSGEISQQTAQILTSPEFSQFVQGLAQGQQPTPDQVAKLLPPELQVAIASDTLQANASALQQQGGFDPGMIVLESQLGRQLSSQDMQNQQIQQVVAAIDQSWSKSQVAPPPQPGADQTGGTASQPGADQSAGQQNLPQPTDNASSGWWAAPAGAATPETSTPVPPTDTTGGSSSGN